MRCGPSTWSLTVSTSWVTAGGDARREAQTSLKRGTLNLRHATEAFTRLVSQAKAVQPVDLAGNPPPAIAPDEPGPGMYAVADTEDI